MKNSTKELEKLFQQIPVYGFGTVEELNSVFKEYLTMLLDMRSSDINNPTLDRLFTSACNIKRLINFSMLAANAKAAEFNFDRASNFLGLDIESMMQLIEPSFQRKFHISQS